ncbi:MAG: restriction endonuclease [Flavobacteriales bacterium]|nr:restriction endonuclease [Flavobacteriales bacterium]
MARNSLIDLFLELANPNKETGESRWVYTSEFTGKYKRLELGNGWSWGRKSSRLQREYKVETQRIGKGNAITAIRLAGHNKDLHFNHNIRQDIRDTLGKRKCVMLGINGDSENTIIEIDHKDGRKNDVRVSNIATQKIEDFQPLCKAANDIKRQICKSCKMTDKRWDAKNITGNPYSFYEGDEQYSEDIGCKGCYQYDPVEYRLQTTRMLSEEAVKHSVDFVMNKLYPELFNDKK